MIHHNIGSRSDIRTKRPREQSAATSGPRLAVGMEVASDTNNNKNTSEGEDTMEIESCPNHATDGEQASEASHNVRYNNMNSHKEVTDESGESEDTEKGKFSNDGCSSEGNQNIREPQHQQDGQKLKAANGQQQGHRAANEMKDCAEEVTRKRVGKALEGDQQCSESDIQSLRLPQHERIQRVEPLDINYRSTPASLKLREVLISRLKLILPTGRIQVVSHLCRNIIIGVL